MYKEISKSDFIDAFEKMNRKNKFSYEGLGALYDYLIDYEDDTGNRIELDVIALCCGYTEYKDLEDFQANYNKNYESIEDIRDHTQIIMIDEESFIIQNF